jgi:hypothetical protein|nr:MAG TPA: YonK protein [Caudoviricetes sp.]
MANFVFKEIKQTSAGIIDTDNMTVEVDGEEKKLATLLSVFNGGSVEINVKVKEESELDEPTESNEE